MKWYCYRNYKTGEEFKETVRTPLTDSTPKHEGFELIKVYDLSVTEKEKKAK